MKYYFLVSSLPPLVLGQVPSISYEEVRASLLMNLNSEDLEKVTLFQTFTDLRNIRALWLGQPLDARGNFGEKDLEEALLVRDPLPEFVGDFLDRYENPEDRLRYFASLYASLYAESQEKLKGFLQMYFKFEREVRLCLTALRAKEAGRDLLHEFQFEDPADPMVAFFLAQREAGDVQLPQEYEELKTAFLENSSDPKALYREILKFRLEGIEEMEYDRPFSIDQVLGYLARLMIVEDWAKLDENRGRAALMGSLG